MRTFLKLEPDICLFEREEQDKLKALMGTGAALATAFGAAGKKTLFRASVMALRPLSESQQSED